MKTGLTLVASSLTLVGTICLSSFLLTDNGSSFSRDVYSVSVEGEDVGAVEKVQTLDKPILTPETIATNVQDMVVDIESMKLSNIEAFLEAIEIHFDDEYWKQAKEDIKNRAEFYFSSNLRVIEFIVTEGPIFIGARHADKIEWTYYIKGNYHRTGLIEDRGDATSFGSNELFVTVREAHSVDGNPIGVEIVKYLVL
ncbi:TPA: hypothetical protein I7730_20335 [Vibrio vulnificus]|uniref:Uncharacterized protein n=1 Tax=Vibrio vulnificus TaxID=672 RepID=A0A8H9THH0_VIBVL|nr:hypothetical protein [Vibrio vulnificus]HAS8542140.1 hypothetical protein [Vibrio vulnificus]